jgi:hypothetical protein
MVAGFCEWFAGVGMRGMAAWDEDSEYQDWLKVTVPYVAGRVGDQLRVGRKGPAHFRGKIVARRELLAFAGPL